MVISGVLQRLVQNASSDANVRPGDVADEAETAGSGQ